MSLDDVLASLRAERAALEREDAEAAAASSLQWATPELRARSRRAGGAECVRALWARGGPPPYPGPCASVRVCHCVRCGVCSGGDAGALARALAASEASSESLRRENAALEARLALGAGAAAGVRARAGAGLPAVRGGGLRLA